MPLSKLMRKARTVLVGNTLMDPVHGCNRAGCPPLVLFPGANHSELHEKRFMRKQKGWFPLSTHLLLQNEINFSSLYYALQHAGNATVILNPSPLPSPKEIRDFPWHLIHWLIVNEAETLGLYSALTSERQPHPQSPLARTPTPPKSMPKRELICKLAAHPKFENTNIICTLGADGVMAFLPTFHRPKTIHETPSFMHLPAARLLGGVKDSTGAGDCFTGYFVQGLMEFGQDAKVGVNIKEHDIARMLKTCVHVSVCLVLGESGRLNWFACRPQECASRKRERSIAYPKGPK